MDELLGIPFDELDGLAESLEHAAPADEPPPQAREVRDDLTSDNASTSTHRLHGAGGMAGLAANVVTADLGICVRDTGRAGLGLFATRAYARGEVLFTERPQITVASSTSSRHCGSCMRAMIACPAELPHANCWPVTCRATKCPRCGTLYCCTTCAATAEANGHRRLCEAIASGAVATFEQKCREQGTGLSADPRLAVVSAKLVLAMLAQLAACGDGSGADEASRFAHLADGCDEGGGAGSGASGGPAGAHTLAARLQPLMRATLCLTDDESRLFDNHRVRGLLCAVSSNATWVQPVSSFADYVAASRSVRRRDERGETLRQLEAHCAALRARLPPELLDGTERADEVADVAYGARGAALFVLQSKINHSCRPCCKLVCAFTDATIDVVADADIGVGQEITISYVSPALDGARRRQMLKASYGFSCACEACAKELTGCGAYA